MACRICVFAFAIIAPAANAVVMRGATSNFLGSDAGERMRPDVVANTLAKIEEEWKKDADVFTECNSTTADCKGAPESFAKSCATVVSAVVQGSGGDRDVVKEYMNNVCSQKSLLGWRKARCSDFATEIVTRGMVADKYANRENLHPEKVCTRFWATFVDMERKREAEEAKVRAEQEKARAEQEKKDAIAAAEAKTKAEAEAKAEAERRAKEEALREQEEKQQKAKREAEEAKARAVEAGARLAQKKAEAEAVQKAAQLKLQEAETAEKEHQALQAENDKAEAMIANATKAAPAATVSNATEPAAAVAPKLAPKVASKPLAKMQVKPAGADMVVAADAAKNTTK
jgi:flagellar biosynthesis GTPase FlhF